MNRPQIPKSDSIQKLAEFWHAHDLLDFEDQLEEVEQPVFERPTDGENPPTLNSWCTRE